MRMRVVVFYLLQIVVHTQRSSRTLSIQSESVPVHTS